MPRRETARSNVAPWTAIRLRSLRAQLDRAYPEARCALDHADPFQLVVATILSAQCTDARVNLTTPALFARYPAPAALASADPGEVEALIRPTGFFRTKARNLIGMAQCLVSRHGGEVPSDPAALGALPGVGQKTANVVLANAFGIPALAVDTHIFRVARRLGLSKGSTPEKVEKDLTRLFPIDGWISLHHQLIFHGRRVCEARRPLCSDCSLLSLCPTGQGHHPDPHTGALREPALPSGQQTSVQAAPEAGPRRIISLVPSVTELLTQWGLGDRLVGRTRYCVEPRWIRATVPAVGGTKDPDLEAIRALAPDLVILEREENTRESAEALEAQGLRVQVLRLENLRDVKAAWVALGEVLGVPEKGRQRAASLDLQPRKRRKRLRALTLVWKSPLVAAGPDRCVSDLVRCGGFEPIGPVGWPRLSEADVEGLAPDLLLLPTDPYRWTNRDAAALAKRFPGTRVEVLEGRALTWALSRTEEGIAKMKELADNP